MDFMMKKMSKEDAERVVDDILSRAVGTFVDPNDTFRTKLIKKALGEYHGDLVVKFGMDPTRPDIHLGHAVVLRKLRQMQDLGCKIIFLIGDFTTLIGDPTGKSKVRPEIEQKTIEENMKTYLAQVGKILSIETDTAGNILHTPTFSWMRNSDWFYGVTDIFVDEKTKVTWNINDTTGAERTVEFDGNSFVGKALIFDKTRMQTQVLHKPARGVTFATILSVLRNITLAQLIERDMFQDRLKSGEPLFMHEMMYPVMQGIDSNVLHDIYGSCDLEVGGTDQTFNLLIGRKVMEMSKKNPQSVLSLELLVGLDGKEKMSKSLDNYIGITDKPADMFGKVMSTSDATLGSYFELCTFTPISEVQKIMKSLESGKLHPKEIKMNIAEQIVDIYHGREAASSARKAFVDTFQNKEIPSDITKLFGTKGALLSDVLVEAGIVASKSEFRRLVEEGAVRKNGETKIEDPFYALSEAMILKIGKHRFVEIVLK